MEPFEYLVYKNYHLLYEVGYHRQGLMEQFLLEMPKIEQNVRKHPNFHKSQKYNIIHSEIEQYCD